MKMTKALFGIILGMAYLSGYAQISEGGQPPSFQYPPKLRSTKAANYQIPVDLNTEQLIWQDETAARNGSPLKIAEVIPVSVNINNSGEWITLPDSTKIWKQSVTAGGAVGLIISYSDFYIPKGGKLFIYNEDQSQILGAYTHATHPQGGSFATELVYGDTFTLEYVASKSSAEEPRIAIESVGYMYNPSLLDGGGNTNLPWFNSPNSTSGKEKCRINVNCPEGANWRDQKRGVVLYFVQIGGGWVACTGSLVNITGTEKKPYILTAWHCFDTRSGTLSINYDSVIAYFNLEYPTCENEDSVPGYEGRTLVGIRPVISIPLIAGGDSFLYEITGNSGVIPADWKVYYNGWDRRDIAPNSGVVIHHPNKDVKKIVTYNKTATSDRFNGDYQGAPNAHWRVVYDGNSVTEGGSSGSPLFNENKLIVGTLSGGASFCETPTYPDFYGKVWYAWDQYSPDADKQLKTALDPANTNVEYLEGYDPNGLPSGIENEILGRKDLVLFPNPAENELNINASSIIRSVSVYNMSGRRIFVQTGYSASTTTIPISAWAKGIYTVKVETENQKLSDKFIKK